jgi:hypothetical protein
MKSDLLDGDSEAERAAFEQTKANAERTFVEDVKWVMSSPRGRRFVWWLLSLTGTRRSSFNNSGSVTAFNEGQRNVGLAVEAQIIDNCHQSYLTMLEEQRTK